MKKKLILAKLGKLKHIDSIKVPKVVKVNPSIDNFFNFKFLLKVHLKVPFKLRIFRDWKIPCPESPGIDEITGIEFTRCFFLSTRYPHRNWVRAGGKLSEYTRGNKSPWSFRVSNKRKQNQQGFPFKSLISFFFLFSVTPSE